MDKNVVLCLLCNKAQDSITTHLKRFCMRDSTQEERDRVASEAKISHKTFSKHGRVWDFSTLEEFCKDAAACVNLCQLLESRGLIIINTPQFYQKTEPAVGLKAEKKNVISAAQQDIEGIRDKITSVTGGSVPKLEMTHFRYFCEAILLLEHQLTAHVVKELKVQDWLERKPVVNGVSVQLSAVDASARRDSVTLNKREEDLFQCYFENVRHIFIQRGSTDQDDEGKFFLGESGLPLTNPAADLQRLIARYSPLEPASDAASTDNRPGPAPVATHSASMTSAPGSIRHWDAFLSAFPVDLNAGPPSKKQCESAGFDNHRHYYNKWRDVQRINRIQYILGYSMNRRHTAPQAADVQRCLDKETWTTNVPTAEEIVKAWTPASQIDEHFLSRCVAEQNWKGLTVKDFGEDKGKGVVAAVPFCKGDVLCDYHGTLVDTAEGKTRLQSGYLFFFKGEGGAGLCIDATQFPCACHPDKDTYGRRMNHSRKHPNVKARRLTLHFSGVPRQVILFHALRDIRVGEELLWDYGVTRKAFGGEGQHLSWLDN